MEQTGNRRLIVVNYEFVQKLLLQTTSWHIYDQLPSDGPPPPPRPWINQVQGSTLLLEEVGEWSKKEQSGIVGVLRCRTKEKRGCQPLDLDVQLIATTQTNLEQAVKEERCWPDFYYRLCAYTIELPPLRQHREDLPLLAAHFLAQLAVPLQQPPCRLSPMALELLLVHSWPGNVRELQERLQQASALATEGQIEPQHLWPRGGGPRQSLNRRTP